MFHPRFAHEYPLHSDIWDGGQEPVLLKVANLVVTATLMDMTDAPRQGQSAHIRFPHQMHICFKCRGAVTKTYFYQKGVMNLVGISSYSRIASCIASAYKFICDRDPSRRPIITSLGIQNIVASGKLDNTNIKLAELKLSTQYKVIYDASKFPGARLEIADGLGPGQTATLKIFMSSKHYAIGGKSHADIVTVSRDFFKYVEDVLYNNVCVLHPPAFPALSASIYAINASELKKRCGGAFTLEVLPECPARGAMLVSPPFYASDDTGGEDGVEGCKRLVYRIAIGDDGEMWEVVRQGQIVGNSVRQRVGAENRDPWLKAVPAAADAPVGQGIQKCSFMYPKIPQLIVWAQAINRNAAIITSTGVFRLTIINLYANLRTQSGVIIHPDGDVYVPKALQATLALEGKTAEADLVRRIWAVCGFRDYPRYNAPTPPDKPLVLKKVASAMNHFAHPCVYEPLIDTIRFAAGGGMLNDGTILAHPGTVNMNAIWDIARVSEKYADVREKQELKRRRAAEEAEAGEAVVYKPVKRARKKQEPVRAREEEEGEAEEAVGKKPVKRGRKSMF